ncbi:MAG: hypothetical protein AAF717_18895 [Bacteroidota bacterium]
MENVPSQQQNTGKPANSEEIDLRQLFNLILKGLNTVFINFLKVFVFFKKNVFILGGLIFIGLLLGFGLNQLSEDKMKTDIIVKPNLESKNYLYNVIGEIEANIEAKDTLFFKELGLGEISLKDLGISIEPFGEKSKAKLDVEYLELLEKFQTSGIVSDVLRAEILENSPFVQKISVFYKDTREGQQIAKTIISYINDNRYYNQLVETYQENAKNRINQNEVLIQQIDTLITNYSRKLGETNDRTESGQIVLDTEEQIDITGLFQQKNLLIRDIEEKKLEIKRREEVISVINFGKAQKVKVPFFERSLILFPSIFIAGFFLFSLFKYLNKKALSILPS